MPLGLSGLAFSTTVFFSRYQLWFLAFSLLALGVGHYVARKGRSLVRPLQVKVLWASTALTGVAAAYYVYSNYYFLIR